MTLRAGALYDHTLRRIPAVHGMLRAIVWRGGRVLVRALSAVRRFELPGDRLLPLYQLQLLTGLYEWGTVRACRRAIRPGMTVADLGAHAGYFTLLFARLVGRAGRVYAFEPHPRTFEILRRNVVRRRLRNVTLIQNAVGRAREVRPLYESALSMGHSLLPVKAYASRVQVETISLDAFLEERGGGEIDFVKIDVEGAEPDVLAGMRRLFARARRLGLVLEFKPALLGAAGHSPEAFLAGLIHQGFRLSRIGPRGRIVPLTADDVTRARNMEKANLLAEKVPTAPRDGAA